MRVPTENAIVEVGGGAGRPGEAAAVDRASYNGATDYRALLII